MENMNKMREALWRELDEYARRGKLSAGDLDIVHKLTDTIKNLDKIEMLEDGVSHSSGDWEARGTYGMIPDDGISYRGQKRDGRGRYSQNGYSYGDGRADMICELEDWLRNAADEHERTTIRRCLDSLRELV